MARRIPAPQIVCWVVVLLAHQGIDPPFSHAQSLSPWSIDVVRDRAMVANHGAESIWTTERLQMSWTRPDEGGWSVSVERQQRDRLVDVATSVHAYRRAGDWTVALGASSTPGADFLSKVSAEAVLSRRVVGTIVASAGYRYLAFRPLDVHQVQPALTWYHPKGEVEGKLYLSRNVATGITSPTLQLRTMYQANSRLGVGGGAAYGDRIFDIASLPTGTSKSSAGFAQVRVGLTTLDSIEIGGVVAHENPAFDYKSFSIGYRRAF